MLLVAFVVVAATLAGIAFEHHHRPARTVADRTLAAMLYGLLPVITYTAFAHLQLTLGAGVGLGLAYAGLGAAGVAAWRLGQRLGFAGPALGAVVVTVIIVNTGYLGFPIVEALLGGHALPHAVIYDQIVSSPMVFTAGFAVGAAFSSHRAASLSVRLRRFVTRNPPLWAAVAGLLAPAAWAPHALVVASHVLVNAMLVIGFLAVGIYLSAERPDRAARLLERPDRRVALALACRFAITPALLAAAALGGVGIPTAYLLQSLMPSGISTLVIGRAFGLDQGLIASIIVWSTIAVLLAATVVYVA